VNWLPETPLPRDLGHFWSLAVEEQFYTLWPALVFFLPRRALWRATIGLLLVDMLCRAVFSIWPPEFATGQWLDLATFARADTLAIGALLAQQERRGSLAGAAHWATPAAIMAGGAMIGIRLTERAGIAGLLTYNLKWPVIAIGVGAVLVVALSNPPAFLRWRALRWIGQVSYGVYVIHALFGGWLHDTFPLDQAPLIFALQLGITLPLAAASWYLFESPILSQKRRWPMPVPRAARERLAA